MKATGIRRRGARSSASRLPGRFLLERAPLIAVSTDPGKGLLATMGNCAQASRRPGIRAGVHLSVYWSSQAMHKPGVGGVQMEFDFAYTSMTDAQAALESGTIGSVDLVGYYLERIASLDTGPAGLSAVAELNPDALAIAEAMDAKRASGHTLGPLHGIPVVLKANIDTADKMHTTAGSRALRDSYAPADAFLVERLRESGAIVLAKVGLTEWANAMSDHMPGGYSSLYGQGRNPFGEDISPGGSSSGSGVALAADYCLGAIGSDTAGSILSPANQTSTVGLRPTMGLVSRTGMVPIAFTQDTAGPMARTVRDVALLLDVLRGVDPADPVTGRQVGQTVGGYAQTLRPDALKGARLGTVREPYDRALGAEEGQVFDQAVAALRSLGATVVDPVDVPGAKRPWDYALLRYEVKPALDAYLSRLLPHVPVHSLDDLIAYNQAHADVMLPFGQSEFEFAQRTSLTDPVYLNTLRRHRAWAREEGVDHVLSAQGLDALVFPQWRGSGLVAAGGYPALTVPAGATAGGRPVGFTFVAEAFSEAKLLAFAYAWEQAIRPAVRPAI